MAVKAPAAGVSAPGIEIDHRSCESPRDGVSAGERGAQIGRAQADQLLIGVDALAFLGGQRLRNRDTFDEADDRDQYGGHQQRADQVRGQPRQGQRRQALRHLTDDFDTPRVQPEGPDRNGGYHNGRHRPCLGQHIRQQRRHPDASQRGFEVLAHPEQEGRCQHADHQGDPVGLAEILNDRSQHLGQSMPMRADPQDVLELAGGDQDARCRDEPGNHRVRQEVGQKAQPQHAQQHQEPA